MSSKRAVRLKVVVAGTSHYIRVHSGRAAALHSYLRARGVPSSPPQPSSQDVDSIELGRGLDIKAVQAILDSWS